MGLGGPGRRGAGSGAIVLSESKVWLGPFAKDENDGQPACRLDLPAVLFVVNHNFQCIPSRWRKLAHPRLTRGGYTSYKDGRHIGLRSRHTYIVVTIHRQASQVFFTEVDDDSLSS